MAAFGSGNARRSRAKNAPMILLCFIVTFVALYAAFVMNSYTKLRQKQQDTRIPPSNNAVQHKVASKKGISQSNKNHNPQCSFREYPKRRYYGLQDSTQPDFLENAEYIFGKLPMLLQVDTSRLSPLQGKLCVNQTEWHHKDENKDSFPFADGTNPSILALKRVSSLAINVPNAKFLATICMTNSLCSWKDSAEEKQLYHISDKDKPDTVRTVLLWLNDDMETLHETTIFLERNAHWGRRNPPKQNNDGTFVLEIKPLDDARLFIYNDSMWISYRDGPSFGYDKQVLNPLHFESDKVAIKASESVPFCCGRNMALMEHQQVSKMI